MKRIFKGAMVSVLFGFFAITNTTFAQPVMKVGQIMMVRIPTAQIKVGGRIISVRLNYAPFTTKRAYFNRMLRGKKIRVWGNLRGRTLTATKLQLLSGGKMWVRGTKGRVNNTRRNNNNNRRYNNNRRNNKRYNNRRNRNKRRSYAFYPRKVRKVRGNRCPRNMSRVSYVQARKNKRILCRKLRRYQTARLMGNSVLRKRRGRCSIEKNASRRRVRFVMCTKRLKYNNNSRRRKRINKRRRKKNSNYAYNNKRNFFRYDYDRYGKSKRNKRFTKSWRRKKYNEYRRNPYYKNLRKYKGKIKSIRWPNAIIQTKRGPLKVEIGPASNFSQIGANARNLIGKRALFIANGMNRKTPIIKAVRFRNYTIRIRHKNSNRDYRQMDDLDVIDVIDNDDRLDDGSAIDNIGEPNINRNRGNDDDDHDDEGDEYDDDLERRTPIPDDDDDDY